MKKQKQYVMNPSALSPDGYIIHQGKLSGISFGCRTSRDNGCGWICAYNFLHHMTGTDDWLQVCRDMEHHVLLRGLLGVNVFGLWWYLHRQGFRFSLAFTRRGTEKKWAKARRTQPSPCAIMLYFHKKGGHYITFTDGRDGLPRFLNLRYGDPDDCRTLQEVYRIHVFFPLTVTLISRKPAPRAAGSGGS